MDLLYPDAEPRSKRKSQFSWNNARLASVYCTSATQSDVNLGMPSRIGEDKLGRVVELQVSPLQA